MAGRWLAAQGQVGLTGDRASKRNISNMKPRILLVTTVTWPSAARLAAAFAMLGAHVEAVFGRGHVLAVSRFLARAHRYRPLHPYSSIAAAVRAARPELVIACDDRALDLLLKLDGFDALLERSLGPRETFSVLTARAPSIAAARAEGIAAPLTLAVPDLDALPAVLAETGLPCVMKADGSWGGDGVKFVNTLDEAVRAFRKLQGPPARLRSLYRAVKRKDWHFVGEALAPRSAVVNAQAMIAGIPATSLFAARDGQVLAALHMDVVRWQGESGPASIMRRVDCRIMEDAARKIAGRFRLNGLHGLDFMRDSAGVPHLIEINPRATQISHLVLGPDLPAALLGRPARPVVTECRDIALFPQLLTAQNLTGAVYRDLPWEDPAVLQAAAKQVLPAAACLDLIAEFAPRSAGAPAFH
jgi:hypothetical protein